MREKNENDYLSTCYSKGVAQVTQAKSGARRKLLTQRMLSRIVEHSWLQSTDKNGKQEHQLTITKEANNEI